MLETFLGGGSTKFRSMRTGRGPDGARSAVCAPQSRVGAPPGPWRRACCAGRHAHVRPPTLPRALRPGARRVRDRARARRRGARGAHGLWPRPDGRGHRRLRVAGWDRLERGRRVRDPVRDRPNLRRHLSRPHLRDQLERRARSRPRPRRLPVLRAGCRSRRAGRHRDRCRRRARPERPARHARRGGALSLGRPRRVRGAHPPLGRARHQRHRAGADDLHRPLLLGSVRREQRLRRAAALARAVHERALPEHQRPLERLGLLAVHVDRLRPRDRRQRRPQRLQRHLRGAAGARARRSAPDGLDRCGRVRRDPRLGARPRLRRLDRRPRLRRRPGGRPRGRGLSDPRHRAPRRRRRSRILDARALRPDGRRRAPRVRVRHRRGGRGQRAAHGLAGHARVRASLASLRAGRATPRRRPGRVRGVALRRARHRPRRRRDARPVGRERPVAARADALRGER